MAQLLTDKLKKIEDENTAYGIYVAECRALDDKPMTPGVFADWWRGLKGLPRRHSPKTKEATAMAGPLVSPGSIEDVKEAYKLWCGMPHAQRTGFVKPGLPTFRKDIYPKLREKYLAKQNQPSTTRRTKKSEAAPAAAPNLMEQFAAFLQQQGIALPNAAEVEEEKTDDFEERTPRDQVPTDAARNMLLWALNTEGLIGEAFEAAQENGDVLDNEAVYITQEIGERVMADHFGPLSK